MNAHEALMALVSLANNGDECPCRTFDGIVDRDGGRDAVEQLLTDLSHAADLMFTGAHQHALEHAAHVVILAMMTGYNLGVDDTFEAIGTSQVIVPDTLASVDFLGDE